MESSVAPAADASALARYAPQITCLLILLALVDSQVLGAIAPQIAAGLGAAESTVANGITVYAIFGATVALGLAWYPRAHHPRRWLPLAGALFAIASLTTGLAPHVAVFLAGRALAGFAGGLISALAIAALANASSYENRGSQMAWVAICYFLAPVVGVPVAALVTGYAGWRVPFLLVAVCVGAASLLVRAVPLASLVDTSEGADAGLASRGFASALATLWKMLVRSRSTFMGIASAAFVSGGLVGFTAYLGIWLATAYSASPQVVGGVYALAGVGAVAGGAAGGKLADRFGKRRVAALACLAMVLAMPLATSFAWGASLLALVGVAAFVASVRVAPLQALVTELVPPNERTTYIALRNAASQIGIALAVIAASAVYARMGMVGVALACAGMTLVAWLLITLIREPGVEPARRSVPRRLGTAAAAALLCALVVLFAVAPWLLSVLVTKARTRPDERNRPETPATYGATFDPVTFASTDGIELAGWYMPHTSVPITIVMTHGMFRSRYELLPLAVDLWKLGYGVVIYDLRRHGENGGEFSTLGYEERYDVEGAIALARARAPETRIALLGVSMGAAATLLAAAESPPVLAIVADSSFLSLDHTVTHHLALAHIPTFPFAPLLVDLTAWRMGFRPSAFDVKAAVSKIDAPILFIGGTADMRMPIADVLEPLASAARNPRSRRLIVEGATHGHTYSTDPAGYVAAVNSFLQNSLAETPLR